MTAFVFLIRHGSHDLLGKVLTGRTTPIRLNARGVAEAELAAERLRTKGVSLVQSGPLERTRQTAEIIASRCGCAMSTCEAVTEIDFGAWSGKEFEVLELDRSWRDWNRDRGPARAPGGESLYDVQARVADHLQAIGRSAPNSAVAIVSHADVIKTALVTCLGLPLPQIDRFDIAPGSISTIVIGDRRARVVAMNERVAA
jgi:broad specificity phosphatase PhoE